jgi:hypothetical protein
MRGSIQGSCWTAGRVWCSSQGVRSRMSRGISGSRARRFANTSGRLKRTRAGAKTSLSSQEREEIKSLRREVAQLRRANEILKAASVFFAGELDPHRPK